MSNLQLSAIYIYPIKSLRAVPVPAAELTVRGPREDRRWMLVDQEGNFLSQRERRQMALLQPIFEGEQMLIRDLRGGRPELEISRFPKVDGLRRQVKIWGDSCEAVTVSSEADQWFSEALQVDCSLVYMPEDSLRPIDPAYAQAGETVSFADGFPYLIIGEASLADLNRRLSEPIPMSRFRPNLVFSGAAPFAEDHWGTFYIGKARFRGTKPCARCQIPTIDLRTGESSAEPTRTLAGFRRQGNKILFGLNACWEPEAANQRIAVRVGDRLVT